MSYLKLLLERIPQGPNWAGDYNGILPARMRMLEPMAAYLLRGTNGLVLSDMFREPGDSLRARQQGRRGVQPPGFSLHNFGIAIDINIPATMKGVGVKSKRALDEYMAAHGWHCHRNDHANEHEAWHYNALGKGFVPTGRTTQAAAEEFITQLYPKLSKKTKPTDCELQVALSDLKLYTGEIDGQFGPLSKGAVGQFQKAWGLPANKEVTYKTWRTLMYVTAQRLVVG